MTSPVSENDRIRGYLQQQAQKPIEDLISRVEEAVLELEAAANAVPAGDLDVTVTGETWTPMDCIRHAAGSNVSGAQSILYVAHTGALPEGEDTPLPATREAILARHRASIDSLYVHVRDADPAAFLDVTWKHPFFGDLNWREWFLFLRIHSKDHARQLTTMTGALD
ncbi:MAG: DinB family protein [Chloroflexi bacterium]|nr:DinB family protein [Chloroflexota bacterium]